MQFWIGILRNNCLMISRFHWQIISGNAKIMHCGILFNNLISYHIAFRVGAVKRILRRELQAMNCSSTRSYSSVTWPVKNGLLTTSNRLRKRPLSNNDDKITLRQDPGQISGCITNTQSNLCFFFIRMYH